MNIVLDYADLLDERVEGGIPAASLDAVLAERFAAALRTLQGWRGEGRLGFLDLPDDPALDLEVGAAVARWIDEVDDVVLVGIGGSALGAVVLRDTLAGLRWNASEPVRRGRPRLHVVDNPDPDTVRGLLADLDPTRTAVNVVSKSGSTAETMAVFLVVRTWLEAAVEAGSMTGARLRDRILVTTDPEKGVLRPWAEERGIDTLPVPENVGGRFSVLSAVGLVPAAVLGVDLGALRRGALRMRERCLAPDFRKNPAGLLAVLLHAMDTEHDRPIHVLMPYADRLRPLAFWFQQLWAESLGKAGGGPTPLPAVGTVDQHAQVQLFMEGPHDKVVLFVKAPFDGDLEIPVGAETPRGLEYFEGHTLGALVDAERRATTEALRVAGRPSATIELDAVDAEHLGALFMLLEVATVLAGAVYGVDPLDQPGVEQGKIFTYGLMGREGFAAPDLPERDPHRRVGSEG
jgi:glucose-6-phosphate isomerase